MPFVQCVSCGDTFETPDTNESYCRDCKLHQKIFQDILDDVHEPSFALVSKKSYVPIAPEESGLKNPVTWRDSFDILLGSMHKEDITNLQDLINIIARMGWKKTRTNPFHAAVIVTYLYLRNPQMCKQREMFLELYGDYNEKVRVYHRFDTFFNPFRFLLGSHPGMMTYLGKLNITFQDLIAEAEALLKKEEAVE